VVFKGRKLRAVVAVLAVCGVGVSCSGNTSAGSSDGGTLIDGAQLATGDNLTSFDPGLVQTLDESQITRALYNGLTDFDFTDKKHPVLKGLVAEKWEMNSTATEVTFTIKKGIEFSNGDPVLPSSFKYAWVRAGKKDFASPYGYLISYIKDGSKLQKGEVDNLDGSIVADDNAMTLKVTLEDPQADFPAIVSHTFFFPVPEKEVSKLTDQSQWDKGLMIGNGPFKMEKPKNDQEVVVVRNDKWAGNIYGDKKAKLAKIVFKISKDVQSSYAAFEAGQVDTATIPSGQYKDAMSKFKNTAKDPTIASYYFDFGFTDPQFSGAQNTKLRQAISLIIDRDQINQKVYEGVRQLPTGITPPGVPGFKDGLCKFCKRDVDQAKKLFDEWKNEGGTLSGQVTVDFNTGGGHEDVVSIVQNNLKELGIESKTNPISEKYFTAIAKPGGCHFCRSGWNADYPTYGNFMYDLFSTSALEGNNQGHFSDPEFDRLNLAAQAETDDVKRGELYNKAEDYLLNTVTAAVPINWYTGDQVYSNKVTFFEEPPLTQIPWEKVDVQK